jgi:hypothetical protein
MPSDTDIVNFALVALGANRITSLTDGTPNANRANDVYEMLRDSKLRGHNWNFATKRAQLARLSDEPAFGYDYQHALPSDWLRVISVHDNDAGLGGIDYRVETYDSQKVLLSNSQDVYLRYVARITDPNLWAADFAVTFAVDLAESLAIAIPNSGTTRQQLEEKVRKMMLGTKSTDAMGSAPEKRPPGSWSSARFGWPSNRWPR